MKLTFLILLVAVSAFMGCRKILEIPTPENFRTPERIFSTPEGANEAIAGIYMAWKLVYNIPASLTVLNGLSSGEFENYSTNHYLEQIETTNINSTNPLLPWPALFNTVYQANAAIEALNNTRTLDTAVKNVFLAEAKFIRAHCYFELVNFFGELPLITSTDININQNISRSSVDSVYGLITADLLEADKLLTSSSFDDNRKYRVNSGLVSAFLARVYLYRQEWERAEEMATKVIESGGYRLVDDIDSINIANNSESLFQFDVNSSEGNLEAASFIFVGSPIVVLTDNFLNAFEDTDIRKERWISSRLHQGVRYYFPYKYKLSGFVQNERYTLFRLAEQYLIRSEARANRNNPDEAINDLNVIRGRSSLPLINSDITTDSCLTLILKERRIELFAEPSHRWFDLKRLGLASSVISLLKPDWLSSDLLYPLPYDDVIRNRHLAQNPGYN